MTQVYGFAKNWLPLTCICGICVKKQSLFSTHTCFHNENA